MKFSASIVAVTLAIAAPLSASAFSTAPFTRGVTTSAGSYGVASYNRKASTHPTSCTTSLSHPTLCSCPSCITSPHPSNCDCFSCSGGFTSALRMSTEVEAEEASTSATLTTDEIPAEVEALDGVASSEEAHNVERPARGSGIHKHSKDSDRQKRTPLSDLELGSTVTAKVKTITSYGAFLDIGARSDALIHVSRLSDDFIANVEDVVKVGDEISVRIVSVDTEKNQIAVTMRSEEVEARGSGGGGGSDASSARPTRRRERPQRSGADQSSQAAAIKSLAEKGFDDAKFVDGEVVSTLDFGAFVRFDTAQLGEGLEGEVDGLVHISALAEGRVGSVSDVANVGDKVQVRIRSVDADAGRISLSMISKEAEGASRPPPREKRGGEEGKGGGMRSPIGSSWKSMGAADWKEQMEEFSKEQPVFTNTAVVDDRRK